MSPCAPRGCYLFSERFLCFSILSRFSNDSNSLSHPFDICIYCQYILIHTICQKYIGSFHTDPLETEQGFSRFILLGNLVSVLKSPLYRLRTACENSIILLAFLLYRPPVLIESRTFPNGALANSAGFILKFLERLNF